MKYKDIELSREEAVAFITLNKCPQRNDEVRTDSCT
jgi:hypothetical protein